MTFVLIPSATSLTVAPAVQLWAAVGPLVGVVIGALLGGTIQGVITWRQERATRRRDMEIFRRDLYLSSLDVVETVDRNARIFVNSLGGREQPDDNDHSARAQWMRERDDAAGQAIVEVSEGSLVLERMLNRVAAVGSVRVAAKLSAAWLILDAYLTSLRDQFPDVDAVGVRFDIQEANRFGKAFLAAKDGYVAAVRKDLNIEQLFGRDPTDEIARPRDQA